MSILTAENIIKYYGGQDVLRGVSVSLARGEKVALVGPNGAGKTTLLRILLGLEEPSGGSVHVARGVRIGYLPQQPTLEGTRTLYEEMLAVFEDLKRQHQALLALAEEMARAKDPTHLMKRYALAEERFEQAGGYTYEARIRGVLGGLGFGPETYAWPLSTLSGGQITQALLARLLLQEPDLLVLDEPTNYLDLTALEWLEAYLQAWPHSLLVVSHDRRFLDRVVTKVWDLHQGRVEVYRGNYTAYVAQREARRERLQKEYEAQQEEILKTQTFIRRYKAGQRSREAAGREKRLARMERLQAPEAERRLRLRLMADLRSGDNVLISEQGVAIGYPRPPAGERACEGQPHLLFETEPFLIRRGQRVALLGANGSGKTTFLRTILGELPPLRGDLRLGASVKVGYLSQAQEELQADRTVLEYIMQAGRLEIEAARAYLARFLFTGDDVFKRAGDLSGGELSRLGLALLAVSGANFLLLDEPTTHLDIASQEVLEAVLREFNGTILFVTHDRYLMDALATHVWEIRDRRLIQYEGNYTDYLEALARAQAISETKEVKGTDSTPRHRREREGMNRRKALAELEACEQEIERLEGQIQHVEHEMAQASEVVDFMRIRSLEEEYRRLQGLLEERLREWERLAVALEESACTS